jgi:hypothetical protein
MDFPKFGLGHFGKFKFLLVIVYLYVLYLLLLGLIGSTSSEAYDPPEVTSASTDKDRAVIMAEGVTHAIEQELDAFFGWLPNDLLFVPNIIDNVTSYQRGVIYATRPASDIIAKTVSRYGKNDTIDKRLVDATSRDFAYSDDVWGFWFVYDCESKYRAGIKEWREWAKSVGTTAKNAGIYNVKSDDVYLILKYCNSMLEYALGNLNKDDIGHFESDNIIYFAKGICAVVENVLRSIVACDYSVMERGGRENIDAALKRLSMIREFNPLYVTAGGDEVGDAMLPNHVAAMARHVDVTANRINDMMQSMEK